MSMGRLADLWRSSGECVVRRWGSCLHNSELVSNCNALGRARVSLPAGPTHEIYVIQEWYTALSLYMVVY